MTDRDLRPTRLQLTLQYAQEFVTEFFDQVSHGVYFSIYSFANNIWQNPISQMAIIVTRDGLAQRLSALGGMVFYIKPQYIV